MKTRLLIMTAAVALVAFSGCGDDITGGLDAGTAYAFTAGTYDITGAQATTDTCNLLAGYQAAGKQVVISDPTGTGAYEFNFDVENPTPDPKTVASAVLDGNTFDQPVGANYTVAFDDGCVLRVQRTVVGDLVADNTAALTLTATIAPDETSVGDCSVDSPSGTDAQCDSLITFTATLAQ